MTTSPTLTELQQDAAFLKAYLGLPCKLRRISAEHWADVFRGSSDDMLRKTALVKIYEDFIASTEDLSMFYFALRDLGDAPSGILRHCDEFWVTDHEQEWNDVLAAIPQDAHFLEGLLAAAALSGGPRVDGDQISKIFRKLTEALRAAAVTRLLGGRVLVRSGNKIKHGMLIHDAGDTVVLDVTRSAESGLPVTQEFIDMLKDGVIAMRQATAVIVSSLILKMQLGALDRVYSLSDSENGTLLESFKDVPPTF